MDSFSSISSFFENSPSLFGHIDPATDRLVGSSHSTRILFFSKVSFGNLWAVGARNSEVEQAWR